MYHIAESLVLSGGKFFVGDNFSQMRFFVVMCDLRVSYVWLPWFELRVNNFGADFVKMCDLCVIGLGDDFGAV